MNFFQWAWDAYKVLIVVLGVTLLGSIISLIIGNTGNALGLLIMFLVVGVFAFIFVKRHWKKLDFYKDKNGNLRNDYKK